MPGMRRSSEAQIQNYLKQASLPPSTNSSAFDGEEKEVLGSGLFYKKGFGINNWKLRGYLVKGDKKVFN